MGPRTGSPGEVGPSNKRRETIQLIWTVILGGKLKKSLEPKRGWKVGGGSEWWSRASRERILVMGFNQLFSSSEVEGSNRTIQMIPSREKEIKTHKESRKEPID